MSTFRPQVKGMLSTHAFEVSSFLFFVGPMTLICVLYVLIGVKLRKSKLLQGVKRRGCEFGRGISGQTRVIRMLSKYKRDERNNSPKPRRCVFSRKMTNIKNSCFNRISALSLSSHLLRRRSCCCRSFLLVLGPVPRAAPDGDLREDDEDDKHGVPRSVHSANLRFGSYVLHVHLHQPAAVQHHEPQIP